MAEMDASINGSGFFLFRVLLQAKEWLNSNCHLFFLINLQTKENMEMLRSNGLRTTERKFC